VTNRLQEQPSPDWAKYDTLVTEALLAFGQDVMYAVHILESARSDKKRNANKKKNKL